MGIRAGLELGAVALLIALFAGYTLHIEHRERTICLAQVQTASSAAQAKAQADILRLTQVHNAELANLRSKSNAEIQKAMAMHESDAERLRQFDAYRRAHAEVGCAAGRSPATGAGAISPQGNGDFLSSLEQVGSELADAVRQGKNALDQCMAERDSLTGK